MSVRPAVLLAACCVAGCGPAAEGGPPSAHFTTIQAVQGTDAASPLAGRVVTIDGIVSGDFQAGDSPDHGDLGGFYVQGEPDGDPRTSDGVFVFERGGPRVDVGVGDAVRVTGTVTEFFGETQIVASAVSVTGRGEVDAVILSLPAAAVTSNHDGRPVADLEHYEGMLVELDIALTVSELRDLERFGEIRLVAGGRPYVYTNDHPPDPAGYARHLQDLAAREIVLDDGDNAAMRRPIRYLPDNPAQGKPPRAGDRVTGIRGNLRYARGSGDSGREGWRIEPVDAPRFVASNPRPAPPERTSGMRVASMNVLNWFTTIDTGAAVCGPDGASPCRGADSAAELERQLAKIATAMLAIDADVTGLVELENNAGDSLRSIVAALNGAARDDRYAFVDTGTIGTDAIRIGFVYRTGRVRLHGAHAVLDAQVDERFDDSRNRPVLAQTFEWVGSGSRATLVLNHLKSKGTPCDDAGDRDTGDGQGNCNATRTAAARAIVDWIATDPTGSGSAEVLVLGDLNAYPREDPLSVFAAAGYVDVVARHALGAPYSYNFDGQAGALDHALATPGFASRVSSAFHWHANADEAPVLDYNLDAGRDPALFDAAAPWRSSDHDPVIVDFDATPAAPSN